MFEGLAPADRLVARSRQLAQLQASFLADLVAVADSVPMAEFAAFEISAALSWTRQAATTQLDFARVVVRRLPKLHAALASGDIDLPKARVIAEGVSGLDLPTGRDVVARILPSASELTTGQLRARLAKLVIEVSPEAAVARHRERVRARRVVLEPTGDGCAALLGLDLPATDALAASNRLTEIARALKHAGDPRCMDQLRADIHLNLLLGKTSDRPSGGVELVATLDTLTELANNPGHLNGYGPVIADIARQVAAQQRATPWTFAIRDTTTGRVHTGITRRRPTAAMTREVRSRDRTCRAPGCRRPAIYADIDHTIPYEVGGLTVPGNLGVLCRHHRVS